MTPDSVPAPAPNPRKIAWRKRADGLLMAKWHRRHFNILRIMGGYEWCRMWIVPDGQGTSWRWRRGFSDTLAQAKRAVCTAAEIADPIVGLSGGTEL